MGLSPQPVSTPPLEQYNSAPDVERLLDIKQSYKYWQQNMKNSEKVPKDAAKSASSLVKAAQLPPSDLLNAEKLFTEKDMLFLKSRLDLLMATGLCSKSKEVDQLLECCLTGCRQTPQGSQGFDPYGSKDEEGLHNEYCSTCDEDDLEEDYELKEIMDENAHFFCRSDGRHHIEVELNDGPPRIGSTDTDEPSCEFTFEYDGKGKLIPTSNNVEERLRQVHLNAPLDLDPDTFTTSNKKKKKKKKKKRSSSIPADKSAPGSIDESLCLLCQYEAFYGQKPIHTMRWLEGKLYQECTRRKGLKDKVESFKKAATRARMADFAHGEDLEGSLNTVGDN